MIDTTHYRGDLVPLIEWVREKTSPPSNAYKRVDAPPFMDFVREQMPQFATFQQWASIVTPETKRDGEWLHGFPHAHAWPEDIITMICYLSGSEGGEIEISRTEDMAESVSVQPAPGLCVFLNSKLWHGVRPVKSGERIAVIVTGFPKTS